MKDVEKVHRQVADVVGIIDSATSAHVPAEHHDHVLLAFAALSRCRSLLLGTVELDRAGRHDILGVTVRALVEIWYFGVIALLGTDDDLEKLEQDHRFWKNDLAEQLPDVTPEEGPTKKFSVHARAKRADVLLAANGQPPGVALEIYKTFYAAESLTNAHAGFESLKAYVVEGPDNTLGIVAQPEPDGTRYGRLRMAVIMTTLLAKWTWEHAGLESSPFDELDIGESE
jgi:hypothetical protein